MEGAAGAPQVDGAPRACAVAALPLDEGEVHGEEGLLPQGAARGYLQGEGGLLAVLQIFHGNRCCVLICSAPAVRICGIWLVQQPAVS